MGIKYVDMIGWDDCPHLCEPYVSKEQRDAMEARLLPHQREARKRGKPSLGAGAIYPIPEEDIIIQPFAIPDFWPRAYALDVGWNRTAALWAAMDPEPEKPVFYLYHEYYRAEALPVVHAASIKSVGSWITGALDPAARGRNQKDGTKLIEEYRKEDLNLVIANNAVESGLHKCLKLFQEDRIKVFSTLNNFFTEYRLYRRDEKGKIVKKMDHLMDDLRYLLNTPNIFKTQQIKEAHDRATAKGEW